jgi:hypothetical protein
MNEHISAAVLWLNEPIALGRVEPFHGASSHHGLLACTTLIAAARPSRNRPSEVSVVYGKAHQGARQNKAKLEYRDCTRFSQGVQPREPIEIKGELPWTIARVGRTVTPSSAITHELYNTGAGGRETGRAPACNHEERDMWAILFSLALAAAVCFGMAAVVLVYSKYLARLRG